MPVDEKLRYARMKAAGICTLCRKAPAASERVFCTFCIEKARTCNMRRYAARVAVGLCAFCPTPAMPGQVRCQKCMARHKQTQAARRAARKAVASA